MVEARGEIPEARQPWVLVVHLRDPGEYDGDGGDFLDSFDPLRSDEELVRMVEGLRDRPVRSDIEHEDAPEDRP